MTIPYTSECETGLRVTVLFSELLWQQWQGAALAFSAGVCSKNRQQSPENSSSLRLSASPHTPYIVLMYILGIQHINTCKNIEVGHLYSKYSLENMLNNLYLQYLNHL